ncbi:MAG: hypothetical protein AAF791_14490 [Bacteroidota bacterium]
MYSQVRGFGIGGGVRVENALWTGSDATLDLRLAQRRQGIVLAVYTSDPHKSPVFGLGSVIAETTRRRRYFGVGPFTSAENRLFLDYASMEAEARLGAYPLGHSGLYVQPSARLLLDRLKGVEEDQEGALERLRADDPKSIVAVESVQDMTRHGVSVGLQLASDRRDRRSYPRSGSLVSVEARRFFSTDGSGLRFNRLAVNTLGYLPIRGRTALVGRTNLVVTRADGDEAIPFYYLPILDARLLTAYPPDRFVGRDVLAMGGGIRFPLANILDVYGVDALVMAYLGNAYNDVFDEASAGVSFRAGSLGEGQGDRVPFRTAVGIGLGLVNLGDERVVLGGLLGLSPDGLSLASLRIAYDLRDARPLFR